MLPTLLSSPSALKGTPPFRGFRFALRHAVTKILFLTFLAGVGLHAQTPPPEPGGPASTDPVQPASKEPAQIDGTPLKTAPFPATATVSNIQATSDLIKMDTAPDGRRRMLFTGRVKIFGGGLTGTCDRMEIFGPLPGTEPGNPSPTGNPTLAATGISAFSKVVATGSVIITSAKQTAFAERAEIYPSPTNPGQPEKLVLSGKPKLTDGTQQITGGLITYRLSESQVDVEIDPANPDERPTVILESFP